jgi:hypothetical protein
MDSGQNGAIPGAVTMKAFVDQPYIDGFLLGIDSEFIAAIELGCFLASMAMGHHPRRFPGDNLTAAWSACIHEFVPPIFRGTLITR